MALAAGTSKMRSASSAARFAQGWDVSRIGRQASRSNIQAGSSCQWAALALRAQRTTSPAGFSITS